MLEDAPKGATTTPKPSADDECVDPILAPGSLCGRYRVVRLLATGGMSQVFEAVHIDLRKPVALKILAPSLRAHRESHLRFASEAVNAASLVHTNILDVMDCGIVDGLPYLVTNLLVGSDLASHLIKRGRLPPAELADILLPVADAIAFGHERGITHRDLKPENIFLHREAHRTIPKVLDFGVARMLGAPRITISASVVGTPHYMAPEQARGDKAVGHAADQYSMGVILYEGLTGRLPRNFAHAHALLYSVAYGSFPRPSAYVQIPVGLERIVLTAMAQNPRDRYGSMQELAAALEPYASPPARAARSASRARFEQTISSTRKATPADRLLQQCLPRAVVRHEVVDISMLMSMLGQRPSLITALVAGLLTLSATYLWLTTSAQAPTIDRQISAPTANLSSTPAGRR